MPHPLAPGGLSAPPRLPPLAVLLVEDNPADARLLLESLREVTGSEELVVRTVRTLAEAQAELRRFSFTCVLVDLGLPDGRGVGNVEALRTIDRSVAIVVLTGADDEHLAAEAIRMGAQEYVVKGHFDGSKLLRLLRHAIQRNQHVHELEDTRRREFFRASHDGLTGLANRELFQDRARQLLAQATRSGESFAICYLDLDRFKVVNDTHGHRVGDALLMRVAEILVESVRQSDTVARLGGDEFVILLWPIDDRTEPDLIARRLSDRVKAIRHLGEAAIDMGVSIGIALFPQHGDNLEALLESSDRAMYEAKRLGGGVAFSDTQPVQAPERTADLRVELAEALQSDRFQLLYHPWVDTLQRRFAGLEVLLRLDRDGRMQRPDQFLPDATASGQIIDIGLHVAMKACRQWRQWRDQGLSSGLLALNVSGVELVDEQYLPSLAAIVAAAGMQPHEIRLEVATDAFAGEQGHRVVSQLRRVRDMGFGVTLDQFGPDGEGLRWLTAAPLDGIKLSRHVLRALAEEGLRGPMRRFLSAVLGAAGGLGLPVIATGVETGDDRVTLQMMGCPLMQGQLFCGIEPAADLPARLRLGPSGLDQDL